MSEAANTASTEAGTESAEATTSAVTEGLEAPVTTDQLPEWARTQISDANAEAAKYRTERNELRTLLETAKAFETKLNDESSAHTATREALAASNLSLAKLTAALNAGVPSSQAASFAERLRGDDAESLAADAQEALKLFGASTGRDSAIDPTPVSGEVIALNDHDGLLSELGRALGTDLSR